MFDLPIHEVIIFVFVVVVFIAAAIVGILQLLAGGEKYRRFLWPLVLLAVMLEVALLVFRAIEIKAVPLTGSFESMIFLTIVFGLIYLCFSFAIKQVWFGSEAHAVAATPWAIVHGVTMILSGAATMFATASAFLYLLGRRKLKRKEVMQVLGRVPNIERLERMNLLGLKACFVLMTFGLVSGIGVAVANSATFEIRVFDSKIILITAVWVLLGTILTLRCIVALKGKTTAYTTIAAFVLILFAIVGTTVFCRTTHDFTKDGVDTIEVSK
jgi:ABC-type uncharacterized transport system permease subunit